MKPNIVLGILAGGKSSRFGKDKSLFQIGNMSFISKILKIIPILDYRPDSISISIYDRDQMTGIYHMIEKDFILESKSDFYKYGLKIKETKIPLGLDLSFIFDSVNIQRKNTRAALFGMHALFSSHPNAYIQLLPCDTPFISIAFLNSIWKHLVRANEKHRAQKKQGKITLDALIPQWKNGYIEPLHGIYSTRSLLPPINSAIINQTYKLSSLFSNLKKIAYFPIERFFQEQPNTHQSFANMNYPIPVVNHPAIIKRSKVE